jgi:hypothetical protein
MLTIDGYIDNICTGNGSSDHAGCSNAGCVMRVNVDWEVGVSLPDGANETEAKVSTRELFQSSP